MGIAIMSCRKLINKCTGTGCFRSYYENIDSFSIYKEKNDILMSFFIV
ncbi:CGGC domain-containing protein [Clostridium saudiense]